MSIKVLTQKQKNLLSNRWDNLYIINICDINEYMEREMIKEFSVFKDENDDDKNDNINKEIILEDLYSDYMNYLLNLLEDSYKNLNELSPLYLIKYIMLLLKKVDNKYFNKITNQKLYKYLHKFSMYC